MKRLDRMKLLRYLLYGIVIALLFFLDGNPLLIPRIYGAAPSLLLSGAIAISVTGTGELASLLFGMSCGLLMDFQKDGPYGFFGILLTVLCYFMALLTQRLFQKKLLPALGMAVVSILVVYGMQWLFGYVFAGSGGIWYGLLHHYLPMAAYTLGTTAPIYALFRWLSYLLRSQRTANAKPNE